MAPNDYHRRAQTSLQPTEATCHIRCFRPQTYRAAVALTYQGAIFLVSAAAEFKRSAKETMHLLIDLDGTLTDPFPGITRCIQHALTALGRPSPSAESLRWCIGPPLKKSLATLLGPQDEHLSDLALAKYRERFGSLGIFENEVYPEIECALDQLNTSGHSLHVATSKPTVFAERIVEHFGLTKYFRSVYGSELDGTRSDKADLIAHILKRDAIVPNDAIMIGDREHDMIGARQNGVAGLGVLWGYGSRSELEVAGAYACIASPTSLLAEVSILRQSRRF